MAMKLTVTPDYARASAANTVNSSAKSVNTNFTGASLTPGASNITPGPGLFSSAMGASSSALQRDMQNMYNGYAAGAAYANEASAQAQQNQFLMNKEFMDLQNAQQEKLLQAQMDFSTQSAERANKFTEEMWNKTAEYNAAQAQLQRDWDERMASTAYQRTMADMKAAGLNPILAYMNGASSFGSGASASIGSTSSAMANTPGANAASGSVGNYTGQGYQVSDTLAIIGGVVGIITDLLNSAKENSYVATFDTKNNKFWDDQADRNIDKKKVESGDMSWQEYELKHGNAVAATPMTLFRQWLNAMKK